MISLLLLNNFYPDEFKRNRERRIIVYGVRSLVMVREPIASARGDLYVILLITIYVVTIDGLVTSDSRAIIAR